MPPASSSSRAVCEWLKRKSDCPECRQPVRVVSRNHAMGNIIDGYLAQHPEKRRDKDELARLDSEDTLGNEPRVIKKRERDDGADLHPYENSDDDGSDGSGGSDDDGFGGGGGGGPVMAMMRLAAQQMRAQMAAAARTPCPACAVPALQIEIMPPTTRRPSALPPRCLGNAYERGVLMDYLSSRGMDVPQLVDEVRREKLPSPSVAFRRLPLPSLCLHV